MRTYADDPGVEQCTRCTNGQVEVSDRWARDQAGLGQHDDVVALAMTAAAQAATHARWLTSHPQDRGPEPPRDVLDRMARYAAAMNSVYPCPTCAPSQFARFRNGCFRPNHHTRSCRLCTEGEKRR